MTHVGFGKPGGWPGFVSEAVNDAWYGTCVYIAHLAKMGEQVVPPVEHVARVCIFGVPERRTPE